MGRAYVVNGTRVFFECAARHKERAENFMLDYEPESEVVLADSQSEAIEKAAKQRSSAGGFSLVDPDG